MTTRGDPMTGSPEGREARRQWFRHRAWIPVAWLSCAANIVSVWFAARPAEAWHATTHAVLAVACGLGAQLLSRRRAATR